MPIASSNLSSRLSSITDAARVQYDPQVLAGYAIDDVVPRVVAKPASAEEAAGIVRFAAAENLAIVPCGGRSKLSIGMLPDCYDIALDMTSLNQIAHYDPGDLTLSADAGLPLAKLNAALAQHRQFLPLLVPYYSSSTIGGTIASGVESPLRQAYGTARDFLTGAEFIDGAGALCKSGGRVVKNVTGYDLHKLFIGSLGTLAIVTRLNFRTFPMPQASRGFVAAFSSADGALSLRRRIAESPLSPITLDVLNPLLAQLFATRIPFAPEPAIFSGEESVAETTLPILGEWFRPTEWQLCAGYAGSPEVLNRYEQEFEKLVQASKRELRPSATAFLDNDRRPALWGRLRETLPLLLAASPSACVFRLAALPETHGGLINALGDIAERAALPCALIARGAGAVYFAILPESSEPTTVALLGRTAEAVFAACAVQGAAASIPWCPTPIKRVVKIFGAPGPDAVAMRRLKAAFDPRNIFAPGRAANS